MIIKQYILTVKLLRLAEFYIKNMSFYTTGLLYYACGINQFHSHENNKLNLQITNMARHFCMGTGAKHKSKNGSVV